MNRRQALALLGLGPAAAARKSPVRVIEMERTFDIDTGRTIGAKFLMSDGTVREWSRLTYERERAIRSI